MKTKHIYIYIYLTNRFQVAVRLFSNRSQMTSKCGKNKKVAHFGQHFQDLGHSFSPYGPPSRQINIYYHSFSPYGPTLSR